MVYEIPTNNAEFTLLVKIDTDRPEKIRIIMKSADVANCEYTNRWNTINGEKTFFIRVPFSSKKAFLIIYNERVGNLDANEDDSFRVTEIKKLPLEKKMDVVDFGNRNLQSFVAFAVRFCFNAGNLSSGVYKSDNGKYTIEYMPTIKDKGGKELSTPARISAETGLMQLSRSMFMKLTFPARMAILLHEYSHFYINDNMYDEVEADLNALLIYLGMGFPRVEAHEAFLKVFENAPSSKNKERYDKLNKFITDFEKNNFLMV